MVVRKGMHVCRARAAAGDYAAYTEENPYDVPSFYFRSKRPLLRIYRVNASAFLLSLCVHDAALCSFSYYSLWRMERVRRNST